MVFSGLYPLDGSEYPALREALDKLRLNDAALVYEPETSARARVRLPRRLPRPAAPRDRARAARARGRPRAHLDRAQRRLPRRARERRGGRRHQPERLAQPRQDRRDPRADREGDGAAAERLRRRGHGAVPEPARRAAGHGLPVRGPRRAALHAAHGRDHLRLLRPAEVAHQGLRVAGLRARPASRTVRAGEGRHPAAGRAGRRVQRDRAQGQGVRVRHVRWRPSCAS